MALPSQTGRPVARRTVMYRRSRRRRRPRTVIALLLVLVAAAVVVVQFRLWPWGDRGPSSSGTDEPVAALSDDAGSESRPLYAPERDYLGETDSPAGAFGAAAGSDSPAEGEAEGGSVREIEMGAPERPPAQPQPFVTAPAEPEPDRRETVRPPQAPTSAETRRALQRVSRGLDLLSTNQPIEGRRELTAVLDSGHLDAQTADRVRRTLSDLSERLLFSPEIVEGDPFVVAYLVQPNDVLSRIPRTMGIQVDWRFIQRINQIVRPERIRPNQRLKLVTGPFHAVIHKRSYRLDLYLGEEPDRAYVASFPVGLGEYNSTPEGRFRVRPGSKLINPEWVNPRTGRRYLPDDPENPIGEHWIGLMPDEERLQGVFGYGIHGTIEPDSIGRQSSMGCVRVLPEHIELLWEMLMEGVSTVEIRP